MKMENASLYVLAAACLLYTEVMSCVFLYVGFACFSNMGGVYIVLYN